MQRDIDKFSEYCNLKELFVNIEKCHAIMFSRKNNPPHFNVDLFLNNVNLSYVSTVRDLGVTLDAKLLFETHIELIVQRALRSLGFVLRVTSGFKNSASLINLYNSVVRPILEFSTVVWSPMYKKYLDRIESVQRKFVNMLDFRFNRRRHYMPYNENVSFYNLQTLESRRKCFDIIFIYKIVNNLIDSEYCTNYLSYNANHYTLHNRQIFNIKICHSNYVLNSPLIRWAQAVNCMPQLDVNLDLFSTSFKRFKGL